MKFRFKALAKQREPDELDAPAMLATPRGWVTVLVVTTVTVAAAGWAVFGHLPETLRAAGILSRPMGVTQVQSLYAGMVREVNVKLSEFVAEGQDLAVVRGPKGGTRTVTAPFPGQVISVDVNGGEVIGSGSPVVTLERIGEAEESLVAILLVPSAQAAGIVPGKDVGLSVSSTPTAAFGLLRGQVSSISPFPITADEAESVFGGRVPGGIDAGQGRLVVVKLRTDAKTASGYAWTTAAGPPYELVSRAAVTGTITLGAKAPITLLFG